MGKPPSLQLKKSLWPGILNRTSVVSKLVTKGREIRADSSCSHVSDSMGDRMSSSLDKEIMATVEVGEIARFKVKGQEGKIRSAVLGEGVDVGCQ